MSRSALAGNQTVTSSRRSAPYFLRPCSAKDYRYQTPIATPKSRNRTVQPLKQVTASNTNTTPRSSADKCAKRHRRASTLCLPDRFPMTELGNAGSPGKREQYLPNPQLPGVGQLSLPDGSRPILLVTGGADPNCPIFKIADTTKVPFTAAQLLGMQVQGVKDHENANPMVQCVLAGEVDNTDSVHLLKYVQDYVCIGKHFLATYSKDCGTWILQGVTDGENPDKFYEIQHPRGEQICVKIMYEKRLAVAEVFREDITVLKMSRGSRSVLDLFEPRPLRSPSHAVLRLYLSGDGQQLFALSHLGIFQHEQDGKEVCGFLLQMSLSETMLPTDDIYRIGASGIMKK